MNTGTFYLLPWVNPDGGTNEYYRNYGDPYWNCDDAALARTVDRQLKHLMQVVQIDGKCASAVACPLRPGIRVLWSDAVEPPNAATA